MDLCVQYVFIVKIGKGDKVPNWMVSGVNPISGTDHHKCSDPGLRGRIRRYLSSPVPIALIQYKRIRIYAKHRPSQNLLRVARSDLVPLYPRAWGGGSI